MYVRVIPKEFKSKEEYVLYLKHLFAYEYSKEHMSKSSVVLDIGCGEGYGSYLLSEHVKKVVGLDVDADIINHSSKKYVKGNLSFELYDGIKIPYSDNYFDCVTCFQVIEHAVDDEALISEIFRVLKEGGFLVLTTPQRAYRLWSWQKPWNKYHIREYSSQVLENLLNEFFPIVDISGVRGCGEIQRIELNRVRINKLDFLNLRRFVPLRVKKSLQNLIFSKHNDNRAWTLKYTVSNFHATENTKHALDILAICRK